MLPSLFYLMKSKRNRSLKGRTNEAHERATQTSSIDSQDRVLAGRRQSVLDSPLRGP